jgi:hypothetical protein
VWFRSNEQVGQSFADDPQPQRTSTVVPTVLSKMTGSKETGLKQSSSGARDMRA